MSTPLRPNWIYETTLRYNQYYPMWHSYPNVTLWAIAWFQGGP